MRLGKTVIVLITLVANRGTGNLNLPANLCGLFWGFHCAYQTAALGTSFIHCSHWPQLQAVAYWIKYSGNKDCVNTDGSKKKWFKLRSNLLQTRGSLQPLKSFGFLLLFMHMHLSTPRKFQQPRSCASVTCLWSFYLQAFSLLLLDVQGLYWLPQQRFPFCVPSACSSFPAFSLYLLTISILFFVPSDLNCLSLGSQKHRHNGRTLQKR